MEKKDRLMSLDAFRGFDMFWIMGGCSFVCRLAVLFGSKGIWGKIGHVPWDGFQFMDTIFPTFLFMAGASFPFSCAKSMERGMSRGRIALRCFRRFVTLALLGWLVQGFFAEFNFATFRIPSVLGYIGFGWMVAAWLYLYVKSPWARLAVGAAILAGVTIAMGLIPAPDAANFAWPTEVLKNRFAQFGTGNFSPVGNIGCWLDRTVLGNHILNKGLFDNEGLGGLPCTVVTAMLGMFAGEIVRIGGTVATGRKALLLLGASVVSLVAGLVLSHWCPIIKNLWSPSFVLVAAAYAFALFSLFYWIVDVKGARRWCFFFQVIGMNSITIYVWQNLVPMGDVARAFLGGAASLLPEHAALVLMSIGHISLCWLLLWFLYRKNVFLKV